MILEQVYSGNRTPNFIRITPVLWKILQKTSWYLFSGHTVYRHLSLEMFYKRYSTYCWICKNKFQDADPNNPQNLINCFSSLRKISQKFVQITWLIPLTYTQTTTPWWRQPRWQKLPRQWRLQLKLITFNHLAAKYIWPSADHHNTIPHSTCHTTGELSFPRNSVRLHTPRASLPTNSHSTHKTVALTHYISDTHGTRFITHALTGFYCEWHSNTTQLSCM